MDSVIDSGTVFLYKIAYLSLQHYVTATKRNKPVQIAIKQKKIGLNPLYKNFSFPLAICTDMQDPDSSIAS